MTDLEFFDKVVHYKKNELKKNTFCWLYPFTNENIIGYYNKIDFKDKKVLLPTASGDHALNAFYLGAKSIDSFDVNPLAKYYVELKIAAIKALSIKEFIYFFYNKNNILKQKNYFNKDTYFNKISKYLNNRYKVFWDYILTNYTYKDLHNSFLFTKDYLDIIGIFESNIYLKKYYNFKKNINELHINYHDINLKDLDKLNKNFDIIILSNIPTFIDKIYVKDALKNLKILLEKIKKENSIIILNYFYSNKLESYNSDLMYDINNINKYFNNTYMFYKFESSDSLNYDENIRKYILNKKDAVLMTK